MKSNSESCHTMMINTKSVFAIIGILISNFCLTSEAQQPSVILIVADQLSWTGVSIHGSSGVGTPNIDRIATEGVRGDRYLITSEGSGSLASLMTGRYRVEQNKEQEISDKWLSRNDLTLGEIFEKNGYVTGFFGRWPFGSSEPQRPEDKGFKAFAGVYGEGVLNHENSDSFIGGEEKKGDGRVNQLIADEAIEFISSQASSDSGTPYLCVVCPVAYRTGNRIPAALLQSLGDVSIKEDKDFCMQATAADCDSIVERLVDLLRQRGELNDTLIVFTSNGAASDETPGDTRPEVGDSSGGRVDEDGTRVPFFVSWPKWISPKRSIIPPIADIDVLPSLKVFCSLMDGSEDENFDGKSMAALAYGLPARWKDRFLFQHLGSNSQRGAVRSLEWRLVRTTESRGEWKLYHMFIDFEQRNNVASDHKDFVERASSAFFEKLNSDLDP